MTTIENLDIDHNVRGNNNLVWRNLHIIDLSREESRSARFQVRNDGKHPDAPFSLLIRPADRDQGPTFHQVGKVTVKFDDSLLTAWRSAGASGRGFKEELTGFVVTSTNGPAVFENIHLDGQAAGYVTLTFRKSASTPRGTFYVDAVELPVLHFADTDVPFPQVGGMGYEIHTGALPP
jgi:hypothetical protein